MKCIMCNEAETVPGLTSILLEREEVALTINNVPTQVCLNCGEAYADEIVTANLLHEAEKMAKAGTKVNVREYVSLSSESVL